jgi:hypothetical protein
MDETPITYVANQYRSYLKPLPLWKRLANVFRRILHLPVYARRMVIVMEPVKLLPAPKEEA